MWSTLQHRIDEVALPARLRRVASRAVAPGEPRRLGDRAGVFDPGRVVGGAALNVGDPLCSFDPDAESDLARPSGTRPVIVGIALQHHSLVRVERGDVIGTGGGHLPEARIDRRMARNGGEEGHRDPAREIAGRSGQLDPELVSADGDACDVPGPALDVVPGPGDVGRELPGGPLHLWAERPFDRVFEGLRRDRLVRGWREAKALADREGVGLAVRGTTGK